MQASRRGFLRGVTAGFGALAFGGCCGLGGRRGERVRLAACGVWGKGFSDWLPMLQSGKAELVALCDVDRTVLPLAQAELKNQGVDLDLSKIPFYDDYRRLLDDHARLRLDALTVSTPDHMHAAIAIRAMKLGINVYVQKPLVRTLWEADYFGKTARDYGVVTQMGNQGSCGAGFRRNVEVLQSGILGDVKEVHVWTNRPVWPQGLAAAAAAQGAAEKIPEGLNWNVWLGVAKDRPFKGAYPIGAKRYDPWNLSPNVYHPFSWRGFIDFGCGAFGDMACHTMNLPFRGLELGTVTKAECTFIEEKNDVTFPMKSVVKMTYAARPSRARPGVKLPEVTLYWYDGNRKPSADLMPQVVATMGKVPDTGCLIIGSKGQVVSTNDYGQLAYLAFNDEKKMQTIFDHPACKLVPEVLPRRAEKPKAEEMDHSAGAASLAEDGHYVEFLDGILGNGPVFAETGSRCYSDTGLSIPMMEGILVGCVAQRVPGVLNWDSKTQKFDVAAANDCVRPYVRSGFEF